MKPTAGIVLVKLCDQVHFGRQQWQVFDLVAEAQRRGWTACDYTVVQNGTGARRDPKHNTRYHVRNQWAFWVVLRNGSACHGPGRRLKHQLTCEVCGKPFSARRADAVPSSAVPPAGRGATVALDSPRTVLPLTHGHVHVRPSVRRSGGRPR